MPQTQADSDAKQSLNKARAAAFELEEPENPYSHMAPSPLDYLPGAGLFRIGQPAQALIAIGAMLFFLVVALSKSFLFWGGLRSFLLSLALMAVSFKDFKDVFAADIIEFWVASLSCIAGFFGAWWLSIRDYRRKVAAGKQTRASMSLSQLAWRAFKKRTIAVVAMCVIAALYGVALLAPMLSPYDPNAQQDFIATALQPPGSALDCLFFKEAETQTIPLREGDDLASRLANALIAQNYALRLRGETERKLIVNSYRIESDNVVCKQGMREKTVPLSELKTNPDGSLVVEKRFYLMGTDQYGRDIFSRVIYGSRISLSIGFLVVAIAITLGMILGVVSGYFGGWVDNLIMRFVDVLIAFPSFFLILIIIASFGNSIYLIVLTISFTSWMGVSRLVRSQVLSLKEQEFIQAARALGLSNSRIIFKHLVPNSLTPVIIAATLRIGGIILTEAALSFLGLGVQPPTASWGNIINEGRDNLLNHWWISTFPGLAIVLTVVSFNLLGDGVRDALDPRQRE
ncbi:MAG: ABC transporter permease [Chloroherpetonaceae bacterium]|nr:ABC transporter permease [Chloroherpetonaceae bacterium]MDW8436612.1 ABC transporter permease [Chloroherpetonaceae bacterium]